MLHASQPRLTDEMMPRPVGRGIIRLAVEVTQAYLNLSDQFEVLRSTVTILRNTSQIPTNRISDPTDHDQRSVGA
jgi:hypothetical protein